MLSFGLAAIALVTTPACAATCPQDPAQSLQSAIAGAMGAVQSGNGPALLAMIGSDGLTFGPEGATVPKAELTRQFQMKAGHYCDLFVCNNKRGALGLKFRPGKTDTQIDAKHGLATVFVNANSNDELDLNFKLIDCRWVLTGVGSVE